ncbi:MAG: HAD-IC family P-type ATPase, partial [Bacteroidota bacterium]|nr:HAD-IC family P-type ATPase [Bacteroidota bacterium]
TGTLTESNQTDISFQGVKLNKQEESLIRSVLQHSTHPLSQSLYQFLKAPVRPVVDYREVSGKGVEGLCEDVYVKIGSAEFTGAGRQDATDILATRVYVRIGEIHLGYFTFHNHYRPGLQNLLAELQQQGKKLAVLSGDNAAEKENLRQFFGEEADLLFNQSPADKLAYVAKLKEQGHRVIMLDDGLNDAGALKMSDAGISITNSVNGFSPSCDAILDASSFIKLAQFLRFARRSLNVILGSFGVSFVYNIIGLSLAVWENPRR